MTLFPDENRLTFNTVDIFAIDLTPNDRKNTPNDRKNTPNDRKKHPKRPQKNTYLHLSALDITLSSVYQDKRCRINQFLSDISPNPSTERPQRGGVATARGNRTICVCIECSCDQATKYIVRN